MSTPAQPGWIATSATVTTCRYQFARLNTLYLGFQTGNKFNITFDYYAHGRLYSGAFQSPKAVPQNEKIAIHYNPLDPQQNSLSASANRNARHSLLRFGVAGSLVLSLLWLAILRGCS